MILTAVFLVFLFHLRDTVWHFKSAAELTQLSLRVRDVAGDLAAELAAGRGWRREGRTGQAAIVFTRLAMLLTPGLAGHFHNTS